MKKIAIITIHFGVNHGTSLQAFALCKYFSNQNYSVSLIDYVPKRYEIWEEYYKKKKGKYNLLLVLGFFPFYFIREIPNRRRFRKFAKNYLPLTQKYRTNLQLRKNPPLADVYVVGSDQVWNSDYNGLEEFSYYLDFVPDKRKIAYSSSFGKSFPLCDKEKMVISPLLQKFEGIGVREDDGLRILNSMGIPSKHVVDPVFLLTQEEWLSFANNKIAMNTSSDDYLLIYVMDGDYERLVEIAEEISRIENLKIYAICFTKIRDRRIKKCFYKCLPQDFVNILYNSRFVVTNSFHGTAFSILFRKPFISVRKSLYNSRIESLLSKLELEKRLVDYDCDIDDYSSFLDSTDLENGVAKLDPWIRESKQFLKIIDK